MRRRTLLAATATAVLGSSTEACSYRKAGKPGPDKVTYVTGNGVSGQEGFVWVARAKGYFAEAGLDVRIALGSAGDYNLSMLKSGRATFANVDYAGVVQRAALGSFRNLTLAGSLTTNTLVALMTLPGRDITGPGDLPGHTIVQTTGSVTGRLFSGYARQAGFDPSKVHWANAAGSALPGLCASGTAPVVAIFVPGAPEIAKAASLPVSAQDVIVMPFSAYLSDLYGYVVATAESVAQSNPDMVRRFISALIKGLQHMVSSPDESAHILTQAVPALSLDVVAEEIRRLKPYVTPSPAGEFDMSKVARSIALTQGLGLFDGHTTTPDAFIDSHVQGM